MSALVAVGAVAVNMVLGILYFLLHNWSGYIALSVSILHPVVLLFYKEKPFRVLDLVYPVHSPRQPLDNTIGAIALYLVLIVVVTSYLRVRLGTPLVEAVPLLHLSRSRHNVLAQFIYRSRFNKCAGGLVRRRGSFY